MKKHQSSRIFIHERLLSPSKLIYVVFALGFFTMGCTSLAIVSDIDGGLSTPKNTEKMTNIIGEEMFWHTPNKKNGNNRFKNVQPPRRLRNTIRRESSDTKKSSSNQLPLYDIMQRKLVVDATEGSRSNNQFDHYGRLMMISRNSYSYSYSYSDSDSDSDSHSYSDSYSYSHSYSYSYDYSNGSDNNQDTPPPSISKSSQNHGEYSQNVLPTPSPSLAVQPENNQEEKESSFRDNGDNGKDGPLVKDDVDNNTEQTQPPVQEGKSFQDHATTCRQGNNIITSNNTPKNPAVYVGVNFDYVMHFRTPPAESTVESIVSQLSKTFRDTVAQKVCNDIDDGRMRMLVSLKAEDRKSQRNLKVVAVIDGSPAKIDDEKVCVPVDGAQSCVVVSAYLLLQLNSTSENETKENEVMTVIDSNMENGKFVESADIQELVTLRLVKSQTERSFSPKMETNNFLAPSSTKEMSAEKESDHDLSMSNSLWFTVVFVAAVIVAGLVLYRKLKTQKVKDDFEITQKLEQPTPDVSLQDVEIEIEFSDYLTTPEERTAQNPPKTPGNTATASGVGSSSSSDDNNSSLRPSIPSRMCAHPNTVIC